MTERYKLLKNWLVKVTGTSSFELKPASEDASFRSYHRLFLEGKTFIVMDAPPQEEDCRPFVQITEMLLNAGVNVPVIHSMDIEQGFLILDDFGHTLYLDELCADTADQLYFDAIMALVNIQSEAAMKGLPDYDEALLRHEIGLFTEWLLAKHLQIELNDEENASLNKLFTILIENALQQPQCFVHRDFHSRNLMMTKSDNPGVIDYQDAVKGPVSYDLVSLLKDCYIKWPKQKVDVWIAFYLQQLSENGTEVDRQQFQRWFDLMGVQRHLKASGIFARLSLRDGKHHYLKDVPRTLSYIVDLKDDYDELITLCELIEEKVLPRFGVTHP